MSRNLFVNKLVKFFVWNVNLMSKYRLQNTPILNLNLWSIPKPGIKTKMNWEMLAKPTVQTLTNWSQNSSLKAAGFFSQKMKMYRTMIIPSKKSIIWVTIEFLITNSVKQIVGEIGPKVYLEKSKNLTYLAFKSF